MKRFIEGQVRSQLTLMPESLEDYIGADNPVRVIDAFVHGLDLAEMGFDPSAAATGRPGYHPALLLKIYIYGYLNRIQSSRRLEREAGRNVELMWLTGRLSPDFKTIADFRRDNGKGIRNVCRRFVALCRQLDLFSEAIVAIDGSKFKAVNNRDKNFTPHKLEQRMKQIDESIERYLQELDTADRTQSADGSHRSQHIQEKLEKLRQQMEYLREIEIQLKQQPDEQLSLTDPDARSMATSGRGSGMVGYNVQTAVDAKNHLIVAHEVTNQGHDRHQLANMAKQAKAVIGCQELRVVADRGYFRGEEILACDEVGITTFVPKPMTSGAKADGRFDKQDFIFDANAGEYQCPAGSRLIWRFSSLERGVLLHKYWSSDCPRCAIKEKCTPSTYRRVARWEHEAVLEAAQQRLDREPDAMRLRRQTVEHPFGTLKAWMGATHFLTRTLDRVSAEMSLHVLAYNLKRAMKILGIGALMAAMQA